MLKGQGMIASYLKIIVGIMFIGSFILLTSCSSTSKKDGPPPYNVDVSRIPDAKPKIEPLSKIGNKSYRVFGKYYNVMSSSKNYKERGIASWYGTKFHARSTSSGEPYNMLAMTAAHKSLPLPTYVRVKNLNNGRTVTVKINDRGPFESNRLIDLSYAAAKKLGIVGHGTARVEVTAIDPRHDSDVDTRAPVFFAKNQYTSSSQRNLMYVQAGAFRNKSNAEKLKRQLQAYVHTPIVIVQSKKLYLVQIGPVKDPWSAARINRQLSLRGLNGKVLFA